MKRLFVIMIMAMFFVFPMNVFSADVDRTFAWEQADYDVVNYWKLCWGAASGGPYDIDCRQIDKTMIQESQEAPVTIPYPDNAKTTYYFVLVAFTDVDHFSGNSNEVPLEVDFIPIPATPVNLRVKIIPQ